MYGHFISYGYGIFLFVLICFGLLTMKKQWQQWIPPFWLYLAVGVNLVGLYLSYTRGAILGLIICAPFYFIKTKLKYFWVTLGILLSALGIAFVLSWSMRFAFFDIHRMRSNDIRISMYKTAIKAFEERPLFGWGYKNFEPHSKMLKEIGRAHV